MENCYNWNGDYILLKEIDKKQYQVGDIYPEILCIFYDDIDVIRYSIIDDNFGMPSPANYMDTEYSIKLRKRSIAILNDLESKGFIKKII